MRSLVAVLLLAAACHGKAKDGPPCATVAGRFFAIAHDDLGKATVDPAVRRAVADQLPAMRDALAQACTDGGWSAQVRDCMVKAGTHVAFEACEQGLTDAQRHALDSAARGETPSP
jgi:hypothetical protein